MLTLPFTQEQFLAVFAGYNDAIWPVQLAGYLLGAVAAGLLFRNKPPDRFIAAILAVMWLWTGIAYHALFFSEINKAAYLFAALFVVEGCLLIYAGIYHNRIRFGYRREPSAWVGLAFMAYAAILYPLIGMATGHHYPETPMFGVTPCPVTIFTFGLLLLTMPPLPRWLLVIPTLWALIGGSAAILLNVPQDWLLLISGLIAVPLITTASRKAA